MNHYTVEGYGFTASGVEEDWVEIGGTRESICSLLARVGVDDITWQLAWAMENPEEEVYRRDSIQRELNGKEHPPAYRIRITVEAEQLTDEQAAAFWKRRRKP